MTYITQMDLEKKVGAEKLVELTQDDRNVAEADSDVVNEAIDYAGSIFDSYARTRYSLPVPLTPLVRSICLDLATHHLFSRRATSDEGIFKVHKLKHDAAIVLLKDLQKGNAALDVPAAVETVLLPTTSDRILTNANRSRLTDDKLSSF